MDIEWLQEWHKPVCQGLPLSLADERPMGQCRKE